MSARRVLRSVAATATVLGLGALSLTTAPAKAGTTTIFDGDGVDYDPACVVGGFTTPPPANGTGSPGGSPCALTTYDGTTELSDISDVALSSASNGDIIATFTVDGTIPAPGSTSFAAADLPSGDFTGGGVYALYQNRTIETNIPYVACPPVPPRPTPVLQRFGSWKDGHHFFVGFSVGWDGTKWVHSAQVGEYDPAPNGGYGFFELGSNDGAGWTSADPHMPYGPEGQGTWLVTVTGNTVTVRSRGVVTRTDTTNCGDGRYNLRYATPGDVIANVKGFSSANRVITLPVVAPFTALCSVSGGRVCPESDVRTVGGFWGISDVTTGNSTAGLLNTNITGIAFTGGSLGGSDTLGDGPTCPTPTLGGALPQNPLFTPDTACQLDDDFAARGSLLPEWWDTPHGFTF